ncbi:MAG TPA: prolyl oligopeptidase family serine peptidase, partial [Pseudomonadales bacterium]|nr:prolyl oligopeptidase family serine peptidase [Pseudomonadales bacterium]
DNKSLYLLKDGDSGRLGLFKMSLDGSNSHKLYVNDTVDVTSAVRSTDRKRVYALRIDDGYPSYLIFSKEDQEAGIFRALLQAFAGNLVYITSKSEDGRFWVVYAATDTNPGAYYLLDTKSHKLRPLIKSHPNIDPGELSPMKPIQFASFDKETIHGYFTPAKGAKPGTAPMVVMVHGGPRARDYWGYDGEVQVLATNGFSVLQINYRGSDGYGLKFMHQGDHQWGDAVQKDIIAGTRWALAQKMAPAAKVCIMGGSFGAYSAVQSAEMAPDLYACVVANAGIYDLPLLYRLGDIKSLYFGKSFLDEAIGHDEAQLAAYSPVNHVDKLKAPVLIAHGKKDPRAPFKHAEELRAAMDKAHKKYQWFIKGREGHGFYNDDDERQYLKTVLKFLHRYT